MVFLPKKKFVVMDDGNKAYYPNETRPCSLSNTFINIISVSMKVCLCLLGIAGRYLLVRCIHAPLLT
jgi:hypothetical protein